MLRFVLLPLKLLVFGLSSVIVWRGRLRLLRDVQCSLPFLFNLAEKPRLDCVRGERFGFERVHASLPYRNIIIWFYRDRGDFDVRIASADAPREFHELTTLLSVLNTKEPVRRHCVRNLQEAAELLVFIGITFARRFRLSRGRP